MLITLCGCTTDLRLCYSHMPKQLSHRAALADNLQMSRVKKKKTILCICKNKGADQLRSNCATDQRLCFRFIDCTTLYFKNPKIKPLTIVCCCTTRFVSDLVGNHEDRFTHYVTCLKCVSVDFRILTTWSVKIISIVLGTKLFQIHINQALRYL